MLGLAEIAFAISTVRSTSTLRYAKYEPQKRKDVSCMMEREVAIQNLPVGSIRTVQLMDCEGHKLLFFLNPYISNGFAEEIAIAV